MTALGLTINQGLKVLLPGDIDDCWVVSGEQAASAAGGKVKSGLTKVIAAGHEVTTIPTFRAKAGKPDVQGKSNGGSAADVLKGILGCFTGIVAKESSGVWLTFRAALVKQGKVASCMVVGSKLPSALRYNFNGLHQVTVRWTGAKFYLTNPLAPNGSKPQVISEAALKAALLAYDGKVHAVLVSPEPVVAPEPPPVVVEPVPPVEPEPVPPAGPTQADLDAAHEAGVNEGIASEKARLRELLGL